MDEPTTHAAPPIKLARLGSAVALIFVVGAILRVLRIRLDRELLVASVRVIAQLTVLALILTPIFTINAPTIVLPYAALMGGFAAREVAVSTRHEYPRLFAHAVLSLLLGGGAGFAVCATLVLTPTPWWDAQVMLPVCGMLFGNALSALALGVERLLCALADGGTAELQTILACGGSGWESSLPSTRAAMRTGLAPTLNAMSAMGLVSIPGMMTGSVLSGTPPMLAARYQMAIMFLISFSSTVALTAALLLARRAVFDVDQHRLRPGRIRAKSAGAGRTDVLAAAAAAAAALFKRAPRRTEAPSHSRPRRRLFARPDAYARVGDGAPGRVEYHVEGIAGGGGGVDPGPPSPASPKRLEEVVTTPTHAPIEGGLVLELAAATIHAPHADVDAPIDSPLLAGATLRLLRGQQLALRGPSGCGKSVLLRALALLEPIDGGELRLVGCSPEVVGALAWRARVRYVRQPGGAGLESTPRALAASLQALHAQSSRRHAARTARHESTEGDEALLDDEANLEGVVDASGGGMSGLAALAEEVGLGAHLLDAPWSSLSGGQSQRLYLCVMMALDPEVLLLDEPTSACDAAAALLVEACVRRRVEAGAAAVWVSHDDAQVERVADAVVEFADAAEV